VSNHLALVTRVSSVIPSMVALFGRLNSWTPRSRARVG
jgi:hypothetical protein